MNKEKQRTFLDNLFHHDLDEIPFWLAWLVRLGRFVFQTFSEFVKDNCFTRAQGMAYVSLLTLVPVMAVFLSFWARFGKFKILLDKIQALLIEHMIPTSSDVILEYLEKFTEKSAALSLVGVITLVMMTVWLFSTIEGSFNDVWQVRKRRSLKHKIMAFTSVIIWVPVMIGLSFWVTGELKVLVGFDALVQSPILNRLIYYLSPLGLSTLAFTMAFIVIPATRVRIKSALIGGAVCAVLWETAKVGFAAYAIRATTYSSIYGSLSVLPFFLIWLYYTWMIVLYGLEVAYTHQNFESLMASRRLYETPQGRERVLLALRLFASIANAFNEGRPPVNEAKLVERFSLPFEIVKDVLRTLEDQGFILLTAGEQEGYVPARALAKLPVRQLIEAVYKEGPAFLAGVKGDPLSDKLEKLLAQSEEKAWQGLEDISFAGLLEDNQDR